MTRHRDYYEDQAEAEAHNTAPTFPLQPEGDSWLGGLCGRHAPEAQGGALGQRCTLCCA